MKHSTVFYQPPVTKQGTKVTTDQMYADLEERLNSIEAKSNAVEKMLVRISKALKVAVDTNKSLRSERDNAVIALRSTKAKMKKLAALLVLEAK